MSTPRIKVRGAARAKGIPAGYVLGRISKGNGDVELLQLPELERLGVASREGVARTFGELTFLALVDTPDTYAGQGGKVVAVKSSVDGLEFVSVQSVIPLSLGVEPGTIVTDGAGNFVTVPYV